MLLSFSRKKTTNQKPQQTKWQNTRKNTEDQSLFPSETVFESLYLLSSPGTGKSAELRNEQQAMSSRSKTKAYLNTHKQSKSALSLAEKELIFSMAALFLLCFVLVARKVSITQYSFGYCWAVLQCCLFDIPPLTVDAGSGQKSWEGTQTGQLTQTDYGIFHIMWHLLSKRSYKKGRGRRETEKNLLFFFTSACGLCFCFIKLSSSWLIRFFHLLFSPLHTLSW